MAEIKGKARLNSRETPEISSRSAHTMTTIRRFTTDDLFRFNNVNMDELTETVPTARLLTTEPGQDPDSCAFAV